MKQELLLGKIIYTVLAVSGLIFLSYNNKIYAYDETKNLILNKEIIENQAYENAVVEYTGTVSGVYKNDYGIISVYFKNQRLGKKLTVNIMPNLGFSKELNAGMEIKVIGIIKPYKDKLQLQPLDKDSVLILETKQTVDLCEDAVEMSQIAKQIGNYVNIANFKMSNKREFTAKKSGKTHFSFSLVKDGKYYNAIIFENNYKNLKNIVEQYQNFCATVKISRYNDEISLQIENLSEYKK